MKFNSFSGTGGERNHLSSEKTEENCVHCCPRFWLVVRSKRQNGLCSPGPPSQFLVTLTLIGNGVLLKYFYLCYITWPSRSSTG